MLEPWDQNWGGLADWAKLPQLVPTIPALLAQAKAQHPDRPVFILDDQAITYGELEIKSAKFAGRLLQSGVGKGSHVGVMLPNDESFLITWLGIVRIGAIAVTLPSLATGAEIARITRHADLQLLVGPRRYLHHDYSTRLLEAFPGAAAQAEQIWLDDMPFLRGIWLWCDTGDDCPDWARRIDLNEDGLSPNLLEAAQASVHASDPAGIIYTSGSTAEPKGVIHSQGSFIRQGLKLAASFGYEPGERGYASLPFFWVGGLTTTAMCLMTAGGTILASRKTGAALLDFLESHCTTSVVSWPHIVRQLADDPTFPGRDWSSMRNGFFYDALPRDRRPCDPTLLATPIGMTETNGPYTVVDRHLAEDQRGSLGRLMPGVQARLVEPDTGAILGEWLDETLHADSGDQVGILHLRSDVMMLGMVKRERSEVFTPDGWYASGDLVSFKDGHLHYHGRADDLIKAHGANVSPREVESVIVKMHGVTSAHAAGVADSVRGTVVGAVVVLEPGHELSTEAIRAECARVLASYKVPRVIVTCGAGELPVLASSKVDRRGLVRMLEARAAQM